MAQNQEAKLTLARNLSYILKSRGIDAKTLANLAGVPRSTVVEWLNGGSPRLRSIHKLAQHLNMSIEALAFDTVAGTTKESYELVLYRITDEQIRQKLFDYRPKD